MGKSMLTWHWLQNRASQVRGDWAGQFWYSFYEQGADLNDFCVHALAYICGAPPSAFPAALGKVPSGKKPRRDAQVAFRYTCGRNIS